MCGTRSAAAAAALSLALSACGGGYTTPTDPSGQPTIPADAVTITIVGVAGVQSFSPNPATVPAGRTIVWHNVDTITHRVVLDNGQLDTGNIAPGGYSGPTTLVAPLGYHCSIHPVMVGRLAAVTPTAGDNADTGSDGKGTGDGGSTY
jgi:plastocyanin